MKVLRIAQVIGLVALAAFVLLLHNANPANLLMKPLPSMPPALVITLVAIIAWLIGWLPGRMRTWRLQRKLAHAEADRDALALELESARRTEPSDPVIPDREAADLRRGDDPSDYL